MPSKKPTPAHSWQHMHVHDRIFQRSDSLQELAYSPYCLSTSDLRQILNLSVESDIGSAVLNAGRGPATATATSVRSHEAQDGAAILSASALATPVPDTVVMNTATKTGQETNNVASGSSKRSSLSPNSMSSCYSNSSSADGKKEKEKSCKRSTIEMEKRTEKSRFSKWLFRRSNLAWHDRKPLHQPSKASQSQTNVHNVNAASNEQRTAARNQQEEGFENQHPTIQEKQHRESTSSSTLSRLQRIEDMLELFAVSMAANLDATPERSRRMSVPQTTATASTQTSSIQICDETRQQNLLRTVSDLNARLAALEVHASNLEKINCMLSGAYDYYQEVQTSIKAESSSLRQHILESEAEIIAQFDARLRQFVDERDKLITDQHEMIGALSLQLGGREQEITSLKNTIQQYENELRSLRGVVKQYDSKMQEIERGIGCLEGQWAWIQPLIQRAKSEGC